MSLRQLSIQWKITLLAGLCLLGIVTLLVGLSLYRMEQSSELVKASSMEMLDEAAQARIEQDKRLGLEGRLQSIDEAHFKEFSDAQKNISRLRDRLATADVRLSVLIDATDSASGCNVPSTTSAVGVVHAARRAQLDPAHAQRIVAITGDGDRGLIALAACQAYVRGVAH